MELGVVTNRFQLGNLPFPNSNPRGMEMEIPLLILSWILCLPYGVRIQVRLWAGIPIGNSKPVFFSPIAKKSNKITREYHPNKQKQTHNFITRNFLKPREQTHPPTKSQRSE